MTGTSGVQESLIITDLSPETEYTFNISARDEAGNEAENAPLSLQFSTTAELDTQVPSDFTANAGEITSSSIELLLNATDDFGTVIYDITYNSNSLTVTGTSGVQESLIITDLSPQTEYTFNISARDEAGNEAENAPLSVQALTTAELDTQSPSDFTAHVGAITSSSIELLLNAIDDFGTVIYDITYNSNSLTVPGTSGMQESLVITELSPETEYTFTINVRDEAGNMAGDALVVQETTKAIVDVSVCLGTSNEAHQGLFTTGYNFSFETVGANVVITFELLDSDKSVTTVSLMKESPLVEVPMNLVAPNKYSLTVGFFNAGDVITYACKFNYLNGMAMTKYISYMVGGDCFILGVEDDVLSQSLKIFPNPIDDVIQLESQIEPLTKVEIYDLMGNKVKEYHQELNVIKVDDLSKGLYLIKVYTAKSFTIRKILKR